MARRTPDRSSITRSQTVAYSRKSKTESDATDAEPAEASDKASDKDAVKAAIATMKMPTQADAPPAEKTDKPTLKVELKEPPQTVDEIATEPARARVDTVG